MEAHIVFWLPTPPKIESKLDLRSLTVATIEAINGNHWRKIFTIASKLAVTNSQEWKGYKNEKLFTYVSFVFDQDVFDRCEAQHKFVVGKQLTELKPVDLGAKVICCSDESSSIKRSVFHSKGVFWTPYLDYRQFPNNLIAAVRLCM